MTICIVAISEDANCFVAVSDQRIFFDENMPAADGMVRKVTYLSDSWNVMFSGDTGRATEVIEESRRRLYPVAGQVTLEAVREAVCGAYQAVRDRHVFNRLVAQLGFKSIDEFRREAPKLWGTDLFAKKLDAIEEFDLDLLLLVFGYEELPIDTDPLFRFRHIFLVLNPGDAESHDMEGFCAIGSGEPAATPSLTTNRIDKAHFLYETVYLLCEAKFMAEGLPAVGRATHVEVFGPNGKSVQLENSVIEKVRAIWEERHSNPVPDDAYWALDKLFNSVDPVPNT